MYAMMNATLLDLIVQEKKQIQNYLKLKMSDVKSGRRNIRTDLVFKSLEKRIEELDDDG